VARGDSLWIRRRALPCGALSPRSNTGMSTLATSAACDRIFFIAGLAAMKTRRRKALRLRSVAFSFGRADALSNDRVEFGLLKRLGQIVDGAQAHGCTTLRVSFTHESMTTFNPGFRWRSCSRVCKPSMPGMSRSSSTRSGCSPCERARRLLRRCWRFELCAHPLPTGCGCSAAFRFVIHQQDVGASLISFLVAACQNWFQGNNERKLATAPGSLRPDLAAHALQEAAGDGESEAHAFGRLAAGQAEEIVEDFQVKFRRMPGRYRKR